MTTTGDKQNGAAYTESHKARLTRAFYDHGLPPYMLAGTLRYILSGIPPGGFLSAVANDSLRGAVSHADEENAQRIVAWARFFYNAAPMGCWGSPGAVQRWCEHGGLIGYAQHESAVEELCDSTG